MNNCLNDTELEVIKNLSKAYSKNVNRNYQKHEDIQKLFDKAHYQIKQDVITTILKNINDARTVNILCSSFGYNYLQHIINSNIKEIYCYDMDPSVRELAETFFKEDQKEKYINFIEQDIWVNSTMRNQADLNIFMACEHLPPIKYWDGFKKLGSGKYYAFTTTDFSNIKDHNNIVNSIEEFEDQMPQMLDIIFSDEKDYDGYGKQYTIIGQM